MKRRLSRGAREDLREIYRWIAQDSPRNAQRMVDRVLEVIELLASGAVEGPEVELQDGRKARTWPAPPYRVYYRRTEDLVYILRVYDQRRRPFVLP